MADRIRLAQRVLARLSGEKDLFAFTKESFDENGYFQSALYRKQHKLGRIFGTRVFSHAVPGVIGRIHVHDEMLFDTSPGSFAHYARVGREAMRIIEESLAAVGRSFGDIGHCLDMACGSGRVLRNLQTRIAPRQITACDINEEGVRFLKAEFGVHGIVSSKNLREVQFPRRYDLIFVGSLFSHLSPEIAFDLFDQLFGLLNPRGVIVFSIQGPQCMEHLEAYGWVFPPQEARLRQDLGEKGYAFAPYFPNQDPHYGVAFYAHEALKRILEERFSPGMRLARFAERDWDNHHDLYAFEKQA